MVKRRFSSHLASDEITTHGYRALTFVKYTTVMTTVLTVTSGLSILVGFGCGLVWFWFSLCGVI
jgi:hypothetical protein